MTALSLGPRPPKGWAPAERPRTARMEQELRNQQRRNVPDAEDMVSSELRRWIGQSPVRRMVLELVSSSVFKGVVLFIIFVSSVLLALESPYAWWALRYPERLAAIRHPAVNIAFSTAFTIEFALRLFAFRLSYFYVRMSDGVEEGVLKVMHWNILDMVVVLVSWVDVALSYVPAGASGPAGALLVLRLARVSRPLRTLSFLPSCKTIVETVVSSLASLSEAFKLLVFGILFFAIVGQQLFNGDMRHRCADAATGLQTLADQPCAPRDSWFNVMGTRCAAGEVCLPVGANPNSGATSYDNVPLAALDVFHSVAGAGFSDTMFILAEVNGTPLVYIFYVVVVVVGSLFVLNIFVSVLEQSYNSEVEGKKEEAAQIRAAERELRREIRREERAARKAEGAPAAVAAPTAMRPGTPSARATATVAARIKSRSPSITLAGQRPQSAGAESTGSAWLDEPNKVDAFFYRVFCCCTSARVAPRDAGGVGGRGDAAAVAKASGDDGEEEERGVKALRDLCDHWLFDLVVNLCILGSCVVAAMSVNPFLPADEERVLNACDILFTGVFAVEVVLMVAGYGWQRYWRKGFNRFDFVLVVLAILENTLQGIVDGAVNLAGFRGVEDLGIWLLILSGLKAFRAVRLVRIAYEMKIHSVVELGDRFPRVIGAVGAIFLVLFIVIFVFGIIMMVIYGGLFAGLDGVPTDRQHYDDISWAMMSVLQVILTADGYFNAHDALNEDPITPYWVHWLQELGTFVMFTTIIVCGNLVLLTLVTAVLVSSFNPEEEEESGDDGADDASSSSEDEADAPAGDDAADARKAVVDASAAAKHHEQKKKEYRMFWSRSQLFMHALHGAFAGTFMARFFPPVDVDLDEIIRREEEHERDYKRVVEHASDYSMNHWDVLEAEADFRRYDANGDEKLSVEEATVLLKEMGFDMKKRDTKLALERNVADVDDEGDMQLEFNEFIQLMKKMKEHKKLDAPPSKGRLSALKVKRPRLIMREHARPPYPKGASHIYKACHYIVYHPLYEASNTFLILVSTVILGVEYSWVGEVYANELWATTFVITIFFALDVLLTAYVKSVLEYILTPAHVMDVVVVVVSVASLFAAQYPTLRSLRALRVLRIFQLLSEFKAMRLLLECLSASIQGTCTVFFFLALAVFLFAILGVAIYGGAFAQCVDGDNELMYSQSLVACTASTCQSVCARMGGTWFTPIPNFDSTLNGIWTLFIITTLEEWQPIFYNAVDSRGKGLQPIQRERLGYSWRADFSMVYFVLFIIVNVILMTNLFVGVVCSEFQMMKKKKERMTNITKEQREWVMVQSLLAQHAPTRIPREPRDDANFVQKWCFRIFYHGHSAPPLPDEEEFKGKSAGNVRAHAQAAKKGRKRAGGDNALFKQSIPNLQQAQTRGAKPASGNGWDSEDAKDATFYVALATFTLNAISIVCLMLEHNTMSDQFELILMMVQGACSALLLVDILAKIVAVGLPLYLASSAWYRLELFLEIVTPAYLACRIASLYGVPGLDRRELRLLGSLRAMRFFRLLVFKWLHTVGAIMHALFMSLPSVANVVVLLIFWIIAFDFVGVSMFSGAIIDDWYPDGEGLSENLNFQNLGEGFVTLCVLLRFEGWTALWADLLEAEYRRDRPPTWGIYAYFTVYVVIAVYIMLSVFIALLLDTLENLNAASQNTVDQAAIRRLVTTWSELDPDGDQMIDCAYLGVLLRALGPPFVKPAEVSTLPRLMKILLHLNLPVYLPNDESGIQSKLILPERAQVTYLEVAFELAKRAVVADEPEKYALGPQLERLVLSQLPKAFPIVRELPNDRTFTGEVSVARAIAKMAFDPARRVLAAALDAADDDSDDDNMFSNEVQDDDDLGLRQPLRDGEMRFIAR